MEKYSITLVVGDWSDDGHGKVDTYIVSSNLSKIKLLIAYKKGVEKIGYELTKYCVDYEDHRIPKFLANKLEYLGVQIEQNYLKDEDEDFCEINSDEYATAYMTIAKLGNPELEYEFIEYQRINIGGYGLFY